MKPYLCGVITGLLVAGAVSVGAGVWYETDLEGHQRTMLQAGDGFQQWSDPQGRTGLESWSRPQEPCVR